ncbi:MAG: hypothetical protein IPJ77_11215 [Planctomycetes bacterium]|nr:hypothetical protein [Planctomycetota bacterium]
MSCLENLRAGLLIFDLSPDGHARVVSVRWHGDQAVRAFFKSPMDREEG